MSRVYTDKAMRSRRGKERLRGEQREDGGRDGHPKINPPWTIECLLKILCKCAKEKVADLATIDVEKFDQIYYDDPYYDGTKWTKKRFDGAGSWSATKRKLRLLSKYCCEDAALTIYHELIHKNQPDDMGWPHPSEDDAYAQTEKWAIGCDLPEQGSGLRKKDAATGKWVPDNDAIRKYVDEGYPNPSATPGEEVVGRTESGDTRIMDPKTGKTSTRPPKKGDSYQGPERVRGKEKIDPTVWRCV